MKRILSTLLLGINILGLTIAPVLAENHYYRLYNPQLNQTDNKAEMIYFKVSDNEYKVGLGSKVIGACIITGDIENFGNISKLWKGKCIDINNGNEYRWSEVIPNTFGPEFTSLVKEMSEKGLKYSP